VEQSPSWETDRFSATKEIPRILWNLNVHYRINNSLPLVCILNHINPVHARYPTSWISVFSIILPSMPRSTSWSLSLRFPHQYPVYISPLPHMRYIPRPSYFYWSDHPDNIGEEYRSLSFSLCGLLHSTVTSSHLGPTPYSHCIRDGTPKKFCKLLSCLLTVPHIVLLIHFVRICYRRYTLSIVMHCSFYPFKT